MIQRYVSKISGPLLDRIDIHIDMPAVKYRELRDDSGEASDVIRARIIAAREHQLRRLSVLRIRLVRTISNLQEPAFWLTASCKLGP